MDDHRQETSSIEPGHRLTLDHNGDREGGDASVERDNVGVPNPQSFLTREEFDNLSESGVIDPARIRFSQESVGANFQDGTSITELVVRLKERDGVDLASIKPIRIVERDGKIFTLDNRRLWAFQQANVPIPFRRLDNVPRAEKFKFTTKNDGTSIKVRGI